MKKIFYLMAFTFLLFPGCRAEEEIVPDVPAPVNAAPICCEIRLLDEDLTRGYSEDSKTWTPGQTIRIKFLNGDYELQQQVQYYASQWLDYAFLNFEWVRSSENADIKIAFKWPESQDGNWSTVGTDAQKIPQNEPSMHFNWDNPYLSQSSTIIHEFGHALGMWHEHQHPNNTINWNEDYLYDYYQTHYNWDRNRVYINFFQRISGKATVTDYDKLSIMHYSIPASWTTDGVSISGGYVLSATDKQHIQKLYPFPQARIFCQENVVYSPDGNTIVYHATYSGTDLFHFEWDLPSNIISYQIVDDKVTLKVNGVGSYRVGVRAVGQKRTTDWVYATCNVKDDFSITISLRNRTPETHDFIYGLYFIDPPRPLTPVMDDEYYTEVSPGEVQDYVHNLKRGNYLIEVWANGRSVRGEYNFWVTSNGSYLIAELNKGTYDYAFTFTYP